MDNSKANQQIQSRIVVFGKQNSKSQETDNSQQQTKQTNELTDAELQKQLSSKIEDQQSPGKPQAKQQEEEKKIVVEQQSQQQLYNGIKLNRLIGKGMRGYAVYQGCLNQKQQAIKILNHLTLEESQIIMFNINKARPFEQLDRILKINDIQLINNPIFQTKDIIIVQNLLFSFENYDPSKAALIYATQLAELLEKLHNQNVFIGAIKPTNLFYDANSIYISDMGFSPFFDNKYIDYHSGYLAPESFHNKVFDRRSDIWSLGMVFLTNFFHKIKDPWQFIIDNKLYKEKNLDLDVKPLGSRDLRKLIENMVKYDPEKRISITEIIKNLKELQKDLIKK